MSREIVSHHLGSRRIGTALVVLIAAFGASATPVLANETCPNRQLRTEDHSEQLPDCRAFELVSAPYKDGYYPFFRAVAPDGDHVLYDTIGVFTGAKGNESIQGTTYESTRTLLGWQTTAISPSASEFGFITRIDASPDLSRTLWAGHTMSQSSDAEDLYARESDGTFVPIGPEFPPSTETAPPGPFLTSHEDERQYLGATPNLSHVFFALNPGDREGEELAWPGDETLSGADALSLYEYSGVGNSEPKLVGIRNKGRLSSDREAEMITQCGTKLGGGSGASLYNAISSSGDIVYFTAVAGGECENNTEVGTGPEANEVYARVNESETVDISEPSPEDCEECKTSVREPGFFEGASQNGEKAFFLSGQEDLLPGADGMNLYEYDFKGPEHKKLIRVSGEVAEPSIQGVVRVSEDGSHVYFVAKEVLAANKNANGEEAQKGNDNMFVFDSVTGATSFVAVLSSGDDEDWSRGDSRTVEATPDGQFLVFPSESHLLMTDDHSGTGVAQLFEYDSDTGKLARVSIGQTGRYFCSVTDNLEDGYNCDGNTENGAYTPKFGSPSFNQFDYADQPGTNLDVSENGSTVLFLSNDPLAPQATNSLSGQLCRNVYEYRWSEDDGGMTAGDVYLVSDGQDAAVSEEQCGSVVAQLNPSGVDVFSTSTDQLVAQDTDTQRDIYVAREGGGFLASVAAPGCAGNACQGSLSLAPSLLAAGSTTQVGGGDLAPPAPLLSVMVKPRSLTRAQELAKALTACRKEPKKKRPACDLRARKRYGGKPKAKKGSASSAGIGTSKGGTR